MFGSMCQCYDVEVVTSVPLLVDAGTAACVFRRRLQLVNVCPWGHFDPELFYLLFILN